VVWDDLKLRAPSYDAPAGFIATPIANADQLSAQVNHFKLSGSSSSKSAPVAKASNESKPEPAPVKTESKPDVAPASAKKQDGDEWAEFWLIAR